MTKENKPSHIALAVESQFRASHSLEGFEIPHFHLWKIQAEFRASLPLPKDRLIDLVYLQATLDALLTPLSGTYLNESLATSPTSENLALWVWEKLSHAISDAPLSEIKITLCDLEGVSSGSVRVFR